MQLSCCSKPEGLYFYQVGVPAGVDCFCIIIAKSFKSSIYAHINNYIMVTNKNFEFWLPLWNSQWEQRYTWAEWRSVPAGFKCLKKLKWQNSMKRSNTSIWCMWGKTLEKPLKKKPFVNIYVLRSYVFRSCFRRFSETAVRLNTNRSRPFWKIKIFQIFWNYTVVSCEKQTEIEAIINWRSWHWLQISLVCLRKVNVQQVNKSFFFFFWVRLFPSQSHCVTYK